MIDTTLAKSVESDRRTMSVTEAAALLGISRSTAYECIRTGVLPALRFRRRLVITTKTIEELLRHGGADALGNYRPAHATSQVD